MVSRRRAFSLATGRRHEMHTFTLPSGIEIDLVDVSAFGTHRQG